MDIGSIGYYLNNTEIVCGEILDIEHREHYEEYVETVYLIDRTKLHSPLKRSVCPASINIASVFPTFEKARDQAVKRLEKEKRKIDSIINKIKTNQNGVI